MNKPILVWDENGYPHSVLFDDKYFCKENGYEETLYVSCGGNRLQERFAKLDPSQPGTFTIVETGFGTGLNFCCAWKIWQEHAPSTWKLHFISLDNNPISSEQLERALSLWPLLETQKIALSSQYRPMSTGVGRFDLGSATVTVVFDDVIPALKLILDEGLVGKGADALFFDGFAPAKNPAMWSEDVFAGMARLCYSGTTFATFTVAGWVRRGLEAQGFTIRKEKGYGTKKHILVGQKN